jgi:hypothetical protein
MISETSYGDRCRTCEAGINPKAEFRIYRKIYLQKSLISVDNVF